jgi:hypothetical protein
LIDIWVSRFKLKTIKKSILQICCGVGCGVLEFFKKFFGFYRELLWVYVRMWKKRADFAYGGFCDKITYFT